MKRSIVLGAAAFLLISPPASPAQQSREQAPWRADFDIAFSSSSGNQNMSSWDTSMRVRHNRPELFEFDLRTRAIYSSSEVDGERERTREFYRGDFRVDIAPGQSFGPFVQTQAQHDPFRDLNLRMNSGAGARYQMRRADGQGRASLRVALLHAYERRRGRNLVQTARWNMELDGRQTLTEGIVVDHTTKFQPIYDQMDEYLLSLDTSLRIRLTQRVSLLLRHEFERDSQPPRADLSRDDRIMTAGVSLQL